METHMNTTVRRSGLPQPRLLSALVHAAFLVPAVVGAAGAHAQSAAAPAAAASQAAAKPADDGQTVTVIGVSASLRSAVAAKNDSNSMVEVIASEDIGKLPDTTIAESLARLPG